MHSVSDAHRPAAAGQPERMARALAAIGAAPDLRSAAVELLRGAIELIGGAHGAARVYDLQQHESHQILLELEVEGDGRVLRAEQPIGPPPPGSHGAALLAGSPAILEDDLWTLDRDSYPYYDGVRRHGWRSAVHVPIEARGRRIGSLHIDHRRAGYFTRSDLVLAQALAAHAGGAIERAHLTEQRDAARETAERERQTLLGVVSSMAEGLWVVDESGTVRYANHETGRLLGTDPASLVGRRIDDALPWLTSLLDDPGAATADREAALRRLDESPEFDVTVTGPPRRELSLRYFPVRSGGQRRGYGVILRDVTRARELERLKDELVATVSHELRTPLASLVGFSELLLDAAIPEAERMQYLDVMHREGLRLSALLDDFLDLERLSSGRVRLSLAPADLRHLLERAIAAGNDPAHPIRLEIAGGAAGAGALLVLADAERVQQVLANLLSNARKYSPGGGEISVSARPVDAEQAHASPAGAHDGTAQPRHVEVVVRDRGLGIPAEALPRLFQRFYRVEGEDRRAISGTGLGLAICRMIVEAHGGQIWAQSEGPGRGSAFGFTLPLAPPGAPPLPEVS